MGFERVHWLCVRKVPVLTVLPRLTRLFRSGTKSWIAGEGGDCLADADGAGALAELV